MCILWFIVCIVQVIIAFIAWVIWHVIRKVVESNCDQIGDACICHDTEENVPITGKAIIGLLGIFIETLALCSCGSDYEILVDIRRYVSCMSVGSLCFQTLQALQSARLVASVTGLHHRSIRRPRGNVENLTIRRRPRVFYLNNRVFLSRKYRLIVAPRKFDVLETNISPRSEASCANMLVLRTSNFQGADQTDISAQKLFIVFIVHFFFRAHSKTNMFLGWVLSIRVFSGYFGLIVSLLG